MAGKAKESWGGSWTEQKLNAFEKYVRAYLTIMNKHRDKNGWKLIYFDAFARSGTKETAKEQFPPLFEEMGVTENEANVYRGATERIVSIDQRGFNVYYFIEKNENAKNELETRLAPLNPGQVFNFQFRSEDANEQIDKMAAAMKANKSLYSLALLDPFGMQVNWSSIEKLKDTNTDLWILIPTGVIINRLLDRQGKLSHLEKLVSYLGMTETEIRIYFYPKDQTAALFDIEEGSKKIADPIQKIANLYIQKLHDIFPEVTETPLALLNSKNVPIYHFAFASNNKTAKKIAGQIIGKGLK
ncbi:three-Cys-motif partner protein TcmP [Breznakiellaceae bacterium SP9]